MYRAVLLSALALLLAGPPAAPAAPSFGAPQTVPGTSAAQHQFALAVAGDGTTLLATVLGSGLEREIGVAERPPGGAWGAPTILDTGPIQGFQVAPLLAVNDAGAAVVVWRDSTAGYGASVRPAAGQPWGEPETIATTASEDGRAAIAANGDIIVAWSREVQLPAPGDDSVRVVRRPAGGDWSGPDGVIVENRDYAPGTFRVYDVAFTAGGTPSILYGDTREQDVAFEQRNQQGGWVNENAPFDLPDSQVGPLDSEGRLEPFADGRLLAVWIEFGAYDGGTRRVRHGIRPAAGGTWQPFANAAIWSDDVLTVPTDLEVGVTDAGEAIAAWYAPTAAGARVMVARMSAGAEWSDAVPFAGGLVPFAAAADGGAMAAFWSAPGTLWSAGTDPGGPLGAAAPLASSAGSSHGRRRPAPGRGMEGRARRAAHDRDRRGRLGASATSPAARPEAAAGSAHARRRGARDAERAEGALQEAEGRRALPDPAHVRGRQGHRA